MFDSTILFAFGLTLFAGLSTGIGSALAFFSKESSPRFLASSLGFSAGVMIYVSLVEILSKARISLTAASGDQLGQWYTLIAFFSGIALIAAIDQFIPNAENPHEMHSIEEMDGSEEHRKAHKLKRMGLFTALALAIHNFPEGIATFAAAVDNPTLGVSIAIAIAIHNIPEGIAVSVPIYYATGSKRKAFGYSFASGLAEPLGALLGFTLLRPFFNDLTFGLLFASVAGIMVFISIDELLPAAREYGKHHHSVFGFVAGMGVMAISLILFT